MPGGERVKLLVTGGAGYIGGVVTHALVEAWEVDRSPLPHVHHVTDDLCGFLNRLG